MTKKTCYGWAGKILHLNLATGAAHEETPSGEFYRTNLGGRSLGMHVVMPHFRRQWDDPDMPIVLSAGPLTGTGVPMACTGHITSRSPLTGTVGDDTLTGKFPVTLKRAGYDALVLTGHAPEPTGLIIRDSKIFLINAENLITMETGAVFDSLEEHHELRLAKGADAAICIGPAATHGSLLAAVATDRHHLTGRGGLGLCFAAKNLHFIGVSGSEKIAVHDPEALKRANADIMRLLSASPALMGPYGIRHWGTAAFLDLTHTRRITPTDNFRHTFFALTHKVNAPAMAAQGPFKESGCPDCPVQCIKTLPDGRILPGHDALNHFTALLGNADPDMALDGVAMCFALGLDPVSAGATLACNREISGQGYGRAELSEAVRRMAQGGSLGQGSFRFADECGMPETSMTAKQLELPGFDPRGAVGTGLAYALSTRGGSHSRAFPISHEVLRKPVATDRFTFAGKARIIKLAEDTFAGVESLGVCSLALFAAGLEEYARALRAVTGPVAGKLLTAADVALAGERTCMRERIMNSGNGFHEKDDDLPGRFFSDPGTAGPDQEIPAIDRDDFLKARSAYYAVRGLDGHARPLEEKLASLGLNDDGMTDMDDGGAS